MRSLVLLMVLISQPLFAKQVINFNENWRFTLTSQPDGHQYQLPTHDWQKINLPHDWAVELPYSNEAGAASTGFKAGGTGWYRKTFVLNEQDKAQHLWLEFDGIYNQSQIWLNGHYIGGRPYGYTSFKVDISQYAYFDGRPNQLAVKVNRLSYADSRWYTGSGIYRDVRLVKAPYIHVPMWGVKITTPVATNATAKVKISTEVHASQAFTQTAVLTTKIFDMSNNLIASKQAEFPIAPKQTIEQTIVIDKPRLWNLQSAYLYRAETSLALENNTITAQSEPFGIRTIKFDANRGFFLNNKPVKIKGVNLHHDAGAVGVAVDKSIWRSRLQKLKSVGVNAIRLSHNPHSPQMLELADELGFLVNAEAFDDWDRPKKKSLLRLGDNKVTGIAGHSYSQYFNAWAERDIKALVNRDFNHPSIIMWSIGNEVEWSYPYYPKATSYEEEGGEYYQHAPNYDAEKIRDRLARHNPQTRDNLPRIAKSLSEFVKQVDTTRPVTSGLTHPSVGFASGYTDALDIVGFNYRAHEYEIAHKTYPQAIIYGSENWGDWREWQAVQDKEYVAGIFIWTGFAYKGESGPLPKMGLEISLFDFIGNKTPRGHFFETFWVDKPKTWVGVTKASESEFSYDEDAGWTFTQREYPQDVWATIRKWEWYDIERHWNFSENESVVVQAYTNTDSAELFLNGHSMGGQYLNRFDDRIIKWLVPYQRGELKVVGYNNGKAVTEDKISTHGAIAAIRLSPEAKTLVANGTDSVYVHVELVDENQNLVTDSDAEINFSIEGPVGKTFVDNGSEFNTGNVVGNQVVNHKGRAAILVQASKTPGEVQISASSGEVNAEPIRLIIK